MRNGSIWPATRSADNRDANIKDNGDVTELTIHRGRHQELVRRPSAVLDGPSRAIVGRANRFRRQPTANSQPAHTTLFRWHLGDGQLAQGPRIEHVYKAPGFYRVGLTVTSGATL